MDGLRAGDAPRVAGRWGIAAGGAFAAAALLGAAAMLVHPDLGKASDARMLATVAATPEALTRSAVLNAGRVLLLIPAALGLVAVVRGRCAAASAAAAGLTLAGALGGAVDSVLALTFRAMVETGGVNARMGSLATRIADARGLLVLPLFLADDLAKMALVVALWRARRFPAWALALVPVLFVLHAAEPGGHPGLVARALLDAAVLLAAAFALARARPNWGDAPRGPRPGPSGGLSAQQGQPSPQGWIPAARALRAHSERWPRLPRGGHGAPPSRAVPGYRYPSGPAVGIA